MMQTARMYGVFNPNGELVAAFRDSKMADAMARYDWKGLGEAAYWSVAPQPPTIGRITVGHSDPPEDRHKIKDEPLEHCSTFECQRHPYKPGIWT